MDINFKEYSLSDLEMLIKNAVLEALSPDLKCKNAFDKLFAGLDTSLLNLMCIQVLWTMSSEPSTKLLDALTAYANRAVTTIPLLKDVLTKTKVLSQSVAFYSEVFLKNYFDNKPTLQEYLYLKEGLADFLKEKELQSMRNTLLSLINQIDQVYSITNQTKKLNVPTQLELCLTNHKFIHGSRASFNNLCTLFSFINDCAQGSLASLTASSNDNIDVIAFSLDSEAKVWQLVAEVITRLLKELDKFQYVKPLKI